MTRIVFHEQTLGIQTSGEGVKVRASQLNRYAYCIDMHAKNVKAGDESEQRVYELAVWLKWTFIQVEKSAPGLERGDDADFRRSRS